jgi:DNA uptake protein ComE-like DNA-binding protein
MRKDEWKDFFHFTRRETTGIIALLLLMVLIFCLPALFDYFSPPLPVLRTVENDRIAKELQQKQQVESFQEYDKSEIESKGYDKGEKHLVTLKLFEFDPNTLDDEGWLSLGLSKRTLKTIRNYLSKGGRFRKAEDIKRIYGISPSVAEKLLPFVSIAITDKFEKHHYDSGSFTFNKYEKQTREAKRAAANPLDINSADSLDWLALEGIGPSLTHRILKFREKLGGFYSVAQISEVFGLPDSTFQQLKPLLLCSPSDLKRISINTATAEELEQHPYIRKKLAKVLVSFREQHGVFRSISDFEKIQLIDPAVLAKLVPYISVE